MSSDPSSKSDSSETEVHVLSERHAGGDTHEYEVAVEPGGANAAGTAVEAGEEGPEPVEKESQQVEESERRPAPRWIRPRIDFSTLLYFYDINTWHRRSVNLKARLVGGLGWQLVPADEMDADEAADEQRAALQAFLDDPQAEKEPGRIENSTTETLTRGLVDYYAVGNAFWEVPRQMSGEAAAELYHARAAEMRRARDLSEGYRQIDNGNVLARFRGWGGETPEQQISGGGPANEVLHYYEYDPRSSYYGMPDWISSIGAQVQDRSVVEYNTNLFQNGLMAHFAVTVEGGTLGQEQIDALKDFIRSEHTGTQNAGRGVVLQNEDDNVTINIEPINVDVGDKVMSEVREMPREEVISAHGIPPRMLGIMEAGQLGGGGEVQGQLETFFETTIYPEQERLEAFLNQTVVASFAGGDLGALDWRLKLDRLDIRDDQDRGKFYQMALNPRTGWLTQDEVRQMEGREPLEEPQRAAVQTAKEHPEATADFLTSLRKELEHRS